MEFELPNLDEIVTKAVPFDDKDCHLVRAMKENRREKLKTRIQEYAGLYHLQQLTENDPKRIR